MKPKKSKERGQALILIALAAIGLVGAVALAVDGSAKFSDRRHAQNAADTAALAGALTKSVGLTAGKSETDVCSTASGWTNTAFCLDIIYDAWDRAEGNGYDGASPDSVDVYSPPISGPYTGNTAYVQVIITSYIDTYFARVIGIARTRNIVQAVALAGKGGVLGDGAMIISYDPDPDCSKIGVDNGSVNISGSGIVNLNGGGIFINSQDVCGFSIPNCADLNITGGAGVSSAATFDNINQTGCAESVPERPSQSPVAIPTDVRWPKVPPECGIAPTVSYLGIDSSDGKGEWLIYPGYYEDFPQADLVANKQHIFMASGVYCIDPGGIDHDFDLSWSPTDFVSLNGSSDPVKNKYSAYNPKGITLYIRSGGGFSINANNPTFLDGNTNPSSDYQGYLIILEGTHTSIESCSITGGADIDINGMIFAPYCNITINGGSDSTAILNAQLLGWDIKVTGNNTINFNYDPKYTVKIKRSVGLMR